MDRGVLDSSVLVKSIFKPLKSLSSEIYNSVLIREIDFKGIENIIIEEGKEI